MTKPPLIIQHIIQLQERAEKAEAEAARLREAAIKLREAQKAYISSGPKGERDESKGRAVGVAAAELDAALNSMENEDE